MRKTGTRSFLSGLLIILIVVSSFVFSGCNQRIVTNNPDKMVENAKELYEKGDTQQAIYQLQIYCDERPYNTDGYLLLGDWYMQSQETEKAYDSYRNASLNFGNKENQLSEAQKILKLNQNSNNFSLKIYPNAKFTKNMTLNFSGENITPQNFVSGAINGKAEDLKEDENFLTTEWFTIDSQQKHIFLTGNFNCAIWQFSDDKSNITAINDDSEFRNATNIRFNNKSYSSVEIPENAVKARVTYFNKTNTDTLPSTEGIFVGYGQTLTGYTHTTAKTYEIPDLEENQYITYNSGKWEFFDGANIQTLDWDKLTTEKEAFCSISGDLCGVVDITYNEVKQTTAAKSLQYGVKYSTKSGVSVCQRLGASKGLNFNYTVGNQWVEEGENDFDNAYPWCEMKLCNVSYNDDGERTVTYKGDEGYSENGDNGNVMVQIPKFYSKRVVADGYEEIWISGEKHDGYVLDPVFLGDYGEELDYVYVGAYLGAEFKDKIVSVKDKYPTLQVNYEDTLNMAENNGDGFSEMNYFMCSALQRLFVVETGTIDTSSLFAGDTFMYHYSENKNNSESGLAVSDAKNSNTITLQNNYGTEKITVGSSVTIFNGWDSYKNNNNTQREVTNIEVTDETIQVTFDGKPMNIVKGKTAISNIPAKTGKTNEIEYCTGVPEGNDGKVSFKYRNIENLYGSAMVMLDDDAYMKNHVFYFEDTYGYTNSLDVKVAEQPDGLTDYNKANLNCCVKQMTYDKENPLIMLPSQLGNGASSFNYYGDFWMYKNAEDDVNKYLVYGGSNNSARLSGLFELQAIIADDEFAGQTYSARIMCK